MPQWSEPIKETHTYTKPNGKKYTVTKTYSLLLDSPPFRPESPDAKILQRLLLNVEVSGEVTEDEVLKIKESFMKIYNIETLPQSHQ